MESGFLAGVFGLAATIVSLAVIATLVKNAGGASQIITSSSQGFGSVLTAAMGGGSGITA